MNPSSRVAIVGGGLAGLSAGIALLRAGCEVALFEAGARPGGCCATSDVDGFRFNDGALYVALPALMDAAFERLGIHRPSALPLRQITALQSARVADGTVVTLRQGGDVHVARAGGPASRHDPRHDASRLVRKWRPLLDLLTNEIIVRPFSLATLLYKGWRELPKLRGTVADELNRMVADPAVRAAMASVTLYTGLPPQQTPVMQLIGLIAMLTDELYLPEGGMGRIGEVLAAEFLQRGGQMNLGAPVERIVVERGRANGVAVQGGRIPADVVLSTVSAMTTYKVLLDATVTGPAVLRKVAASPLSQKALSVQLGLRNVVSAESHFMAAIPEMERLDELLEPTHQGTKWLTYTVPTVTMPELAARGGSIVEMFPGIDQGIEAQEWTRERAQRTAADAIELLSQWHDLDIAVMRVRSPKDFQEDLRLFSGAIYGLSPAVGPRALYAHRSTVRGLYLAGQTTYPGYGVASAMLSGIFAANAMRPER